MSTELDVDVSSMMPTLRAGLFSRGTKLRVSCRASVANGPTMSKIANSSLRSSIEMSESQSSSSYSTAHLVYPILSP